MESKKQQILKIIETNSPELATEKILRLLQNEPCTHPYKKLKRNANGLFCRECSKQVSSDPNIY